jgi:hypothetical protein
MMEPRTAGCIDLRSFPWPSNCLTSTLSLASGLTGATNPTVTGNWIIVEVCPKFATSDRGVDEDDIVADEGTTGDSDRASGNPRGPSSTSSPRSVSSGPSGGNDGKCEDVARGNSSTMTGDSVVNWALLDVCQLSDATLTCGDARLNAHDNGLGIQVTF